MKSAATLLSLAAFFVFGAAGCRTASSPERASAKASDPGYTAPAFALVGHVLSVDRERGFVIVDLASDPPSVALRPGVELLVRRRDLQPVARIAVSRYLRGDTLGTRLLEGDPAIDDEVVIRAPHTR